MIHRRTVLAAPALILGVGAAGAHSFRAGDVMIGHPWCLPSDGARTKAMMPLGLSGSRGDVLVGAASPIARAIVFVLDPNRPPEPRWPIMPGRPIAMRPDGPHLLLDGLTSPIRLRDRIALMLTFERNGAKEVELWAENAPYS